MIDDDPKAIPLIETRNTPIPAIRQKNKNQKSNIILKLVFFALVTLILILIILLILSLLKKCSDKILPKEESKEVKKEEKLRRNNSYWNNKYLPISAKPNTYAITLQLLKEAYNLLEHRSANYFYGKVVINVTMVNDSRFLVLNTKSIQIKFVYINYISRNETTQRIHVVETITDDISEQSIFVCKEMLQRFSNYSIEILYSGNITVNSSGIIRTFYQRQENIKKRYGFLYSKLEPVGARRMFPCFDEPDKKSLFKINIIHYSKYIALSNMPLANSFDIKDVDLIVPENDISKTSPLKLSTFNSTTIYMSTYLVAFVLLEDYEKIEEYRLNNNSVAIWGPKDFKPSGKISLAYSISSENNFERNLNFNSPFPKTDHVYIPNFLSGAMENWGLITYREKYLLMPPMQSEYESKEAYMTIAHELAHIWFGNIVTMKTWKDIWLNEGFATYFATVSYFAQLPISSEKKMELFTFQNRYILNKDGKSKSFPVRLSDVKLPDIFNSFTYHKGMAMLAWLNSIMGDQNFRLAIQAYVKKFSQSNPTTEQFFNEIQTYGPKNLLFNVKFADFFEPWLNKIGYPVVTVNYDISNKQVIVSQQSIVTNSSNYDIWPIYTSYKTKMRPLDEPIYFHKKYTKINISLSNDDFVLFNTDAYSYLRVNYSTYLWEKIIENIKNNNSNINPINKIVLLDDNLYLAEAGLIDISISKNFVDTLVNETDVVPWTLFYERVFSKLYDFFNDDEIYLKLSHYVKNLSKKSLEKALQIRLDGKIYIDEEIFQKQIFLLNCEIDNRKVVKLLSTLFQFWIISPNGQYIPKHLVNEILFYGIRENDKEEYWTKMWQLMIKYDPLKYVSREQLAAGLTGTSKPYRLNKLLNYLLTPETHNSDTDKQAFFKHLVSYMLKNYNGFNVLSRWIMSNSKEIKKYGFGDNIPEETAQKHLDKLIGKIVSTTYDINAASPLLTLHSSKDSLTKTVMNNNSWREKLKKFLEKSL